MTTEEIKELNNLFGEINKLLLKHSKKIDELEKDINILKGRMMKHEIS